MNRGFTLIELLVSLAIFALMTALVVAKFGNFNQSTLLTDTAYDVALALRTAQSYGLSVKNSTAGSPAFSYPYGIDFNSTATGAACDSYTSTDQLFVLFADKDSNHLCGSGDLGISTYALTRGAYISYLCAGSDQATCHSNPAITSLDISFQRPNPEASICSSGFNPACSYAYAEITVTSNDKSNSRTISVRQNGQITVLK
ncbi:MAG: prepilin-type N-terminal cleavage/methylation domain-containing protein [Patescibacteria group bacterium]|nr:prepilin-type N-terminal cleavage/methylation domain-containing protein [Patescibacteria group bacterium]